MKLISMAMVFGLVLGFTMFGNSAGADRRIIDVHTHPVSPEIVADLPFLGPPVTADDLIPLMNAARIAVAYLLSDAYVYRLDDFEDVRARVERENDWVLAESRKYPGRFEPFCSLHFLADWAFEELERCAETGHTGVKLHFANNGVDLADQEMFRRYFQFAWRAKELGLMILVHPIINDQNSWRGLLFASAGSGVKTILAHSLSIEYVRLYEFGFFADGRPENIYIDISAMVVRYAQTATKATRLDILSYWRALGIDRVLFGSDYSVKGMEESVEALRSFSRSELGADGLTRSEMRMILFENAQALRTATPKPFASLPVDRDACEEALLNPREFGHKVYFY